MKLGRFELDTIVQGDCLELMKELPDGCVDLVVTDPPYPNMKGGMVYGEFGGVAKQRNKSITIGEPWGFKVEWIQECWRISKYGMMVFCQHQGIKIMLNAIDAEPIALLTWYKRNAPPKVMNVPKFNTENILCYRKTSGLKWKNINTSMFDIPMLQAGCMAGERIVNKSGQAIHRAQKPLELMLNLLVVGGDIIADPFAGTGTTLVAAKQLNRRFLGFEIEQKYVDIANERLKQEVLGI